MQSWMLVLKSSWKWYSPAYDAINKYRYWDKPTSVKIYGLQFGWAPWVSSESLLQYRLRETKLVLKFLLNTVRQTYDRSSALQLVVMVSGKEKMENFKDCQVQVLKVATERGPLGS